MIHSEVTEIAALVNSYVGDPVAGPYEGEDYWFEEDMVYVTSIPVAAKIMQVVNESGKFDRKLVKFRKAGDVTMLGFDTTQDQEPVFTRKLGLNRDVVAEVKVSEIGRFCIFLNGKRETVQHRTMTAAKRYLTQTNQRLVAAEKQILQRMK